MKNGLGQDDELIPLLDRVVDDLDEMTDELVQADLFGPSVNHCVIPVVLCQ